MKFVTQIIWFVIFRWCKVGDVEMSSYEECYLWWCFTAGIFRVRFTNNPTQHSCSHSLFLISTAPTWLHVNFTNYIIWTSRTILSKYPEPYYLNITNSIFRKPCSTLSWYQQLCYVNWVTNFIWTESRTSSEYYKQYHLHITTSTSSHSRTRQL